MSTNLKEQSLVQLKALAYDLSELIQQYTQMLNTVNQEVQLRRNQEAEAEKQTAKKIGDQKAELSEG